MQKLSLASYLVVFSFFGIISMCNSSLAFKFKDYRGYESRDTCTKYENITYTVIHPNITRIILPVREPPSNNKNTPVNIFEIWKNFEVDIFTNSNKISSKCRREIKKYHAAVLRNELNALKMFDASAKLPSGLLSGNVNQYGDFDECMTVSNAQYCLAEIDINSIWIKPISNYKDLVHSHFSIKETFDDPGHRIPGFNLIRWGFCIPKGCSGEDLTNVLEEKLKVQARIRPGLCQRYVKLKHNLTFGHYFTITYFGIIILTISISTILHSKVEFSQTGNKWKEIIRAFSLQQNFIQLTKSSKNKNELKSIHGVRCLSALALLMAHKTMASLYNPYINRTYMTETQAMKWSVIGRNAIIYTDCFLLISGLLNAKVLFEDLDDKEHKIKFSKKILNRLFRILPSLITVILFCTYLLPFMGSGPLWPLVIQHHSDLCRKFMWRNILFIQNYFGFENMCLTHTHQLGIDMQLFIITPVFVYLIWKFKTNGLYTVVFIGLISSGLRFWKTIEYDLSHVVHFGIPISRMFDTANYSYILPTHRATIYFIGIILAYLLRNSSNAQEFSKKQVVFIWTVAYSIGLTTWFGPVTMSVKGYEYDSFQAAIYGAISPITWGLAVAWVIYATERNIGSWFTPILTWKYFEVLAKISYGFYLVQFPVFFYNVGITRHVGEFRNYMMLPPVETGVILIISAVLTLCVEMPFHNMYKIFLGKK